MNYFDVYSPGLSQILADDIPGIVKQAWDTQSSHNTSLQPDDILVRTRPNTDYVINREYGRYEPSWTWSDFSKPGAPVATFATDWTQDVYRPSRPRPYLYTESDPSLYRSRYSSAKTALPDYMPSNLRREPSAVPLPYMARYGLSDRADQHRHINSEFPFRKYRSDFVPYAPYPRLYDTVKYTPNPDWTNIRSYGPRYRKARFIYDLTEQDSSRAREIERVMREARLRELCKGVYSTTYSDHIMSKVTSEARDETTSKVSPAARKAERESGKSLEAETAPSESERQRRHLTLAEKRRRNETLAVDLSSKELLRNEEEPVNNVQPEVKNEVTTMATTYVRKEKEPSPVVQDHKSEEPLAPAPLTPAPAAPAPVAPAPVAPTLAPVETENDITSESADVEAESSVPEVSEVNNEAEATIHPAEETVEIAPESSQQITDFNPDEASADAPTAATEDVAAADGMPEAEVELLGPIEDAQEVETIGQIEDDYQAEPAETDAPDEPTQIQAEEACLPQDEAWPPQDEEQLASDTKIITIEVAEITTAEVVEEEEEEKVETKEEEEEEVVEEEAVEEVVVEDEGGQD